VILRARAILDTVSVEVVSIVKEPDLGEQREVVGLCIVGTSRAKFDECLRSETKRVADIVQAADLDAK
jgi:hypothetical protein